MSISRNVHLTALALIGQLVAASPVGRGQCEIPAGAKLTLPGQGPTTPLGISVSIDGDEAIVGNHDLSIPFFVGSAHVFRFNGSNWAFVQNLTRSGSGSGEGYGTDVAMSGDVAVVGAGNESPGGAVYVFRRVGGTWTQEQRLTPSDPAGGAGRAVAISGNVIVAGAPVSAAGAAYVFRHNGTTWVEEQKLTASDPEDLAYFGTAVAVDGSVLVIGADHDNYPFAVDAGAAYVFRHNGSTWVEEQKISAIPPSTNAAFGSAVAIDGDQLVAGALADGQSAFAGGAAYVFRYNGTAWFLEQKIVASNASEAGNLGLSVAVLGDVIAAGAPGNDTDTSVRSGGVYVYRRVGTTWIEEPRRVASDAYNGSGSKFGFSVAISGERLIAGAPAAFYTLSGAYVYDVAAVDCDGNGTSDSADLASGTYPDCQPNCVPDECDLASGTSDDCDDDGALDDCEIAEGTGADCNVNRRLDWCDLRDGSASDCNADSVPDACAEELEVLFASDPGSPDEFGKSVSMSGPVAVIGAPLDSDGGDYSGSAYVFRRSGDAWAQEAKLRAADAMPLDDFGDHVGIDGNVIIVGVPGDDDGAISDSGSAYIFRRDGSDWVQEIKLPSPDPDADAWFGRGVDISGDRAIVGAQNQKYVYPPPSNTVIGNAGAVYVYRRDGATWVLETTLTALIPTAFARFGWSVDIEEDRASIGVYNDDFGFGDRAAAVYVFKRVGTDWTLEQRIRDPQTKPNQEFGGSLSLDGTRLIVGNSHYTYAPWSSAGSAYVFKREGTIWSQEAQLLSPDPEFREDFGCSVAISGDVAAVLAPGDDHAGGMDEGAVFVFRLRGTTWSVESKQHVLNNGVYSTCGASDVAIDASWLLVGAALNDQQGVDAGAVYAYRAVGGDCNSNSIIDLCDLLACSGDLACNDCNVNAVPDSCDVAGGTSSDDNMNNVPDECDAASIVWNSDPLSPERITRSLRFTLQAPVTASGTPPQVAIKVTMVDLQHPDPRNLTQYPPADFSTFDTGTHGNCAGATTSPNYNGHHCSIDAECLGPNGALSTDDGTCSAGPACTAAAEGNGCARWVGKPWTFYESQGPPQTGPYRASRLQCTPVYWDWIAETASGPITVAGAEIVPSSEYSVQTYAASCKGNEDTCTIVSAPVAMYTRRKGDLEGPYQDPAPAPLTQADVLDISQAVASVKHMAGSPAHYRAQMQPNLPELNADANVLDIVEAVDSVKRLPYSFSGPCACPSTVTCGGSCTGCSGLCVKTCTGGSNDGEPCINNTHCPGVCVGGPTPGAGCPSGVPGGVNCGMGGTCSGMCSSVGTCYDKCGRCSP